MDMRGGGCVRLTMGPGLRARKPDTRGPFGRNAFPMISLIRVTASERLDGENKRHIKHFVHL